MCLWPMKSPKLQKSAISLNFACYGLPQPATACHNPLRPAAACSGLSPPAPACHILLRPATVCYGTPQPATACPSLLRPATSCYGLPQPATACHSLLPPAACHSRLPQPATACHSLLRRCHRLLRAAIAHHGLPQPATACHSLPQTRPSVRLCLTLEPFASPAKLNTRGRGSTGRQRSANRPPTVRKSTVTAPVPLNTSMSQTPTPPALTRKTL